jgi:uncharacterized protein YbaR (Trm112 family)
LPKAFFKARLIQNKEWSRLIMALIKSELMEILVCPADKGELKELEEQKKLECLECGRRYQVREGIPVMLLEDAEAPIKESESE